MSEKTKYYLILGAVAAVAAFFSAGNFNIESFVSLFLGILFLVMGTLKIADLEGFVDTFPEYDMIADRVSFYSYAYPFIELFLGACFLFNLFTVPISILTALLFIVAAYGSWKVYQEYGEDDEVMCACMGSVVQVPFGVQTIVEDLAVAALAIVILVSNL